MTAPLRPPGNTTPQPVETDEQPIALPAPARLGPPESAADTDTPTPPANGIRFTTWP